jgi:hypothetical protein
MDGGAQVFAYRVSSILAPARVTRVHRILVRWADETCRR